MSDFLENIIGFLKKFFTDHEKDIKKIIWMVVREAVNIAYNNATKT